MDNEKKQKAHLVLCLDEIYTDVMGCGGGHLHIILDDNNYKDEDILLCYRDCIKAKDYIGKLLCELLFNFTEEERENILAGWSEYKNDFELDREQYQKTIVDIYRA